MALPRDKPHSAPTRNVQKTDLAPRRCSVIRRARGIGTPTSVPRETPCVRQRHSERGTHRALQFKARTAVSSRQENGPWSGTERACDGRGRRAAPERVSLALFTNHLASPTKTRQHSVKSRVRLYLPASLLSFKKKTPDCFHLQSPVLRQLRAK